MKFQDLINAQVDIERAVFESNKRGAPKPKEPDINYIIECAKSAQKSLSQFLKKTKKSIIPNNTP